MNKKWLLVLALSAGLVGCSHTPDDDELEQLISAHINTKACVHSTLFADMPVPKQREHHNQDALEASNAAGLLEYGASGYALTPLGQQYYDSAHKGFCYIPAYELDQIQVVKTEEKSALAGTPLSHAWYVSFVVRPEAVAEWVYTPQLLEAAQVKDADQLGNSFKYTVRVAQKAGSDELIWADPIFSFKPGLTIHMGF